MLSNGMILRDRYRIVTCIGKGGSSSVYLAEDISIGKKWAVKYLESGDDDMGWLAQNEINMMIRLDYEMFPRIVDAWQEQDGYVIVSDYIEGVTLDRVLRGKHAGRKVLTEWWIRIAEGIRYLHKCKPSILYLDLKLENIMLKTDGSLKLIDFGIAGRIADRGSLYGTPGFAAPEQYYNRGELLDERTDIFAFGMLIYAMQSGKRPVRDLKQQEKLIRNDRRIPARLKTIILGCTAEDKDGRYSSMDEVLRALNAYKGRSCKKLVARCAAAIAVTGLLASGAAAVKYVISEPVESTAQNMMDELRGHIVDGEYTDEGIRIICGYIESGCLDAETSERFAYEVARNYFSIKRSYREALRYFNMLNEEDYPDSMYYKRLCKLQLSFEEDNNRYSECIEEFAKYNRGLGYKDLRFDNTLMLANLYEGMQGRDETCRLAETECLEDGLKDLRYAVECGLFDDEGAEYEAEFCRRLCMLYDEQGDKASALKYGEEALELTPGNKENVINDLRRRLKALAEETNRT